MSTTCARYSPDICSITTLAGLHRALGQLTPAQADACPPERINLAEHLIRRKQVLGRLTHEYYVAALPTCAATEKQVTTRIVFASPTGPSGAALRLRPRRGTSPGVVPACARYTR